MAFFAIAAILGAMMLSHVLRDRKPPRTHAYLHGLFAVVGLLLLLFYTFRNDPGPVECAVLFVVAAVGGITMAVRDFSGRSIPGWLAVVHGLIALSGFVFLLVYTFGAQLV